MRISVWLYLLQQMSASAVLILSCARMLHLRCPLGGLAIVSLLGGSASLIATMVSSPWLQAAMLLPACLLPRLTLHTLPRRAFMHSIRVTLMAHDASTKKLTGYTRLGRIRIGNHVFLGANATVLPGVTIGDGAVIGAGSVVTHDVPAGTVAVGVPARVIGTTQELKERAEAEMAQGGVFDKSYRMGAGLTAEKREELLRATDGKTTYID